MKTKVYRNTDGQWYVDTYKNNEIKSTRKTRRWEKPEYIRMYTEGPCSQIQAYLRSGINKYNPALNFGLSINTVINGIDRELENRLGDPAPKFVYRMDNGELLSHMDENVIVDKGYTSTTVDTHIFSGKFSVLYKIEGLAWDAGSMVDDLSQYNEAEYLFRRGSQFKVIESNSEYYLEHIRKTVRLVRLQYTGRV